jgi:anti-sigma factor RsiW
MHGLDRVVDARRGAAAFFPALITSHLRALAAPSAVDVVSTDRHTVKPWFAGRVDQSPPVIDLADAGFPLVGGRIDYVIERRVPVVVYRRAQHLIDVYWFADGMPAPTVRGVEHHGYYAISGAREDQRAWIVSDLDPVELARFAGLLQATAAATATAAPTASSPSP